jgi:hypothetical protein
MQTEKSFYLQAKEYGRWMTIGWYEKERVLEAYETIRGIHPKKKFRIYDSKNNLIIR